MHPQVDSPRAVGASEGGRDGYAEEAIDTTDWCQNSVPGEASAESGA